MKKIPFFMIFLIFFVVTIALLIVPNFVTKRNIKKFFPYSSAIPENVFVSIPGIWKGHNIQTLNNKTDSIFLTMILHIGDDDFIKGDIFADSINSSYNPKEGKFTVVGKYFKSDIIKMDYYNDNQGLVSLGSYILKLSADGKSLKGKFSGYGHKSNDIINGDILFFK
jgi:hypothetical protein